MTRPRRSLTRIEVLETALAVVEAEGLGALSMRRLGKELGVEAMSLYHHVRDKDDLVNGMNLLVLARLDVDSSGMSWPAALEAFALRLYEAYLPRPDLARALSWTSPTDREVLVTMERVLARLAESGLPPAMQVSAFRGVISMCIGFVVVHTEPQPMSDSVRWTSWGAADVTLTDLPVLSALAPTFDQVPVTHDVAFMIRSVIDALVALAARS
jgi:AcrR family transcriptional regulator